MKSSIIVVHHIVILLLSEQEFAVKFLELRATIKTASSMITKTKSLLYIFIIYNVFPKLLFIFHVINKESSTKKAAGSVCKIWNKKIFCYSPFASIFVCSPPLFMLSDVLFIHNRKLSRMSGKERIRRRVHFIVINEKLCWCQRKTEDGRDKTRMTNLLKYSS